MIDESIRPRMARILRASAGLSAAPEHLQQMADYLGGPKEKRALALAMCTYVDPKTKRSVSTCGLAFRAAMRECGIVDSRISESYEPRVGLVFVDLKVMSAERNALITLGKDDNPLELAGQGDGVMANGDQSDGHVYGIAEMLADGCVSVDGGHTIDPKDDPVNAGKQCIALRRKRWTKGIHGFWYDKADDGGPQRRITHILQIDKLSGEGV